MIKTNIAVQFEYLCFLITYRHKRKANEAFALKFFGFVIKTTAHLCSKTKIFFESNC